MTPGLQESVEQIFDLVKEEAQIVPMERLLLGGISQGCATAVLTLLSSGMRLGGFIGLCGWLPFEKKIAKVPVAFSKDVSGISHHIQSILELQGKAIDIQSRDKTTIANPEGDTDTDNDNLETSLACMSIQSVSKTPIFLAHSHDDETVPISMGAASQKRIRDLGFVVVWKQYQDGGHWIHPGKGVDDMTAFLHETLGISREDSKGLGLGSNST